MYSYEIMPIPMMRKSKADLLLVKSPMLPRYWSCRTQISCKIVLICHDAVAVVVSYDLAPDGSDKVLQDLDSPDETDAGRIPIQVNPIRSTIWSNDGDNLSSDFPVVVTRPRVCFSARISVTMRSEVSLYLTPSPSSELPSAFL
jgi:hypothetical protein